MDVSLGRRGGGGGVPGGVVGGVGVVGVSVVGIPGIFRAGGVCQVIGVRGVGVGVVGVLGVRPVVVTGPSCARQPRDGELAHDLADFGAEAGLLGGFGT